MNDITYKKYIEDQSRKCKLGDQESKQEDEELIVNSRYAKHMENINSKNKSKFKNTIATYCYMKNIQEDNLRSIISDGN
jgi:hypothetical protein